MDCCDSFEFVLLNSFDYAVSKVFSQCHTKVRGSSRFFMHIGGCVEAFPSFDEEVNVRLAWLAELQEQGLRVDLVNITNASASNSRIKL